MRETLKTDGQLRFSWRVGSGEFTRINMRISSCDRTVRPNERAVSRIRLPVWVTRFIPGLDTMEPVDEESVVKPK